jgi:cytochrome d ubiquinol oxidase subunit I
VIAGIGGTLSVVAANAWMNEPAGFSVNDAGKVVDVQPLDVIFNKAFPLQALHMLIAAYLVGGFLIASVYAAGMLRGRRDRYHRLGFTIAFTVAAIATPVQMLVGDQLARWVYENEPTKFAAIELVPKTADDVPETLFGHLNDDGTVSGGIPIPGMASILSDPSTGTSTQIEGLDSFPKGSRPTTRQVNTVHLAWDVMLGLGTLLFLLSAWYGAVWLFKRRNPEGKWFLRIAAASGVLSVLAMEAGWVVTEVGRQPWIVFGEYKVTQAATTNDGVWLTFLVIAALYLGVAVTLILILRAMARRFRERGPGAHEDADAPYGPRPPIGDGDRPLEEVTSR